MSGRSYAVAGLVALLVCGLIAAGCGGDDDETTTTTSPEASAEQTVDSAVKSCTDEAQQLGGTAGTALEGACTSVGDTAKQAHQRGRREGNAGALQGGEVLQERGRPAPSGPGPGRTLEALRLDRRSRVERTTGLGPASAALPRLVQSDGDSSAPVQH